MKDIRITHRKDETVVEFDFFYRWSVGFFSWEHALHFDKLVNEFISKHNLILTIKSKNGVCAQIGNVSDDNNIYFHGMSVHFKGEFNKPELYNSFAEIIKNNSKVEKYLDN